MGYKILMVDDDKELLKMLSRYFTLKNYTCLLYTSLQIRIRSFLAISVYALYNCKKRRHQLMMISTRGRYALRVLADIAEHTDKKYLPMKEVAQRQGISLKYLERILPVLTQNGYIEAVSYTHLDVYKRQSLK